MNTVKQRITRKQMRAAFDAELARMVGKKWVRDHPDYADVWWYASIFGGMFRAGVRYARKRSNAGGKPRRRRRLE